MDEGCKRAVSLYISYLHCIVLHDLPRLVSMVKSSRHFWTYLLWTHINRSCMMTRWNALGTPPGSHWCTGHEAMCGLGSWLPSLWRPNGPKRDAKDRSGACRFWFSACYRRQHLLHPAVSSFSLDNTLLAAAEVWSCPMALDWGTGGDT